MTNKPELMRQLNQLKRDERVLKTEELAIRRLKTDREQREPLARNHEKRMKNRRLQNRVTTELREPVVPAAVVVDEPGVVVDEHIDPMEPGEPGSGAEPLPPGTAAEPPMTDVT